LWQRRVWVSVVVVASVMGAIVISHDVSLNPPAIHKKKTLQLGSATTNVLIDSPRSAIGNLDDPLEPLAARTSVVALLIESEAVRESIAKRVGLDPRVLTTQVERPNPESGARASDIVSEAAGYRVSARPEGNVPIVNLNAQAPTAKEAIAIAEASAEAVTAYVRALQTRDRIPELSRVQLRRLGPARGGAVSPGAARTAALLAFVVVVVVGCLLILVIARVRREVRDVRTENAALEAEPRPPRDEHRNGGPAHDRDDGEPMTFEELTAVGAPDSER
jgi:hypothetical protein